MRELPGSQQSDQWIKNRVGRVTASRICDVMSYLSRSSKTGRAGEESAKRRGYKLELVAERLTGRSADHYVSPYMEHGTETEDEARSYYELATKTLVEPVGFVLHPTLDFSGASPDGLVNEDGLLEIKCPKTETLLQWMDSKEIPDEYMMQMQWELACTGRKWADFYGYDPRLPLGMRHVYQTVERNDALIELIEAEVIKFNAEVEAFIAARGLPLTQWIMPTTPVPEPAVVYHEAGDEYLDALAEGLGLDELVP
jgi:putative phage-type endonuclease